MSGPPLFIGIWGSISTTVIETDKNDKHQSQAKFRDHDGHVRNVTANRPHQVSSRASAAQEVPGPRQDQPVRRAHRAPQDQPPPHLWERRFEGPIADGKRCPTSVDTYRRALKNQFRPDLGELRIGEATTPRMDTVLSNIKDCAAPHRQDLPRHISGAMELAVRYGAISVNPVREVDTIKAHPRTHPEPSAPNKSLSRKHLAADTSSTYPAGALAVLHTSRRRHPSRRTDLLDTSGRSKWSCV
jgi:hypothetical protein